MDKKEIGEILKAAREERGVSLRQVHEETKIPLDALKGIEEGYTVRMLSSFYIRGFMKMYAQYLGVELPKEDVALKPPKEKKPAPKEKTIIKEEEQREFKEPFIEENFQEKIDRILTPQRKDLIRKVLFGLVILFLVIKIGGCFFSKSGKTSKEEKGKQVKVTEKKQETQKSNTQPVAPAAQPKYAAAVEDKSHDVVLSVRAKEDVWLQVKTDGIVVFQTNLKKGVSETWYAKDKVELSGRNIYSLEYEVNGKTLGALGREDRSAKKVVVTKNGLSVEK